MSKLVTRVSRKRGGVQHIITSGIVEAKGWPVDIEGKDMWKKMGFQVM